MPSTTPCHTAKVIDGTAAAEALRASMARHIAAKRVKYPRFAPHLAMIQVGSRADSTLYVRLKVKAAAEIGIQTTVVCLPEGAGVEEIVGVVHKLNVDESVTGVFLQYPLGDHLTEQEGRMITEAIVPEKDIDGFRAYNIGHLSSSGGHPLVTPGPAAGVIHLLEGLDVPIANSHAVVLGRSDIACTPIATMLRRRNASITQCHSHTANVEQFIKVADILVTSIGKAEYVKGSWLKPGAVVIDLGMNLIPDSTRKSGQRLVGDVEYSSASQVASYITPVPGGVGPMTMAKIMENTLFLADRLWDNERGKKITPLKLNILKDVPSDIEIARSQTPKPITQLAEEIGLLLTEYESYGKYKAKVEPNVLERLAHRTNGKYVVISGVTPTPLGEGKSTTTIGLAQALSAHLDRPSFACVRQPSQGPTFGVRGGAAGGGYSQIIPMDEFNLHLTGDIHAVSAANNLLAAAVDARVFHEARQTDEMLYNRLVRSVKGVRTFAPLMFKRLQKLGIYKTNPDDLTSDEIARFARLDIDPETITLNRVVDVNDRFLRKITIGRSRTELGRERDAGFDISVASECMAILALSSDLTDMRSRLGAMVVATSKQGVPITADDLGVGGALAVLMKDAMKPNLVQTLEGTPVFVHAGPFASSGHGNSSILADRIALKLTGTEEGDHPDRTGYVLTECGFGADMGMEKFCDIKCRLSGLTPDATVIVATTRALKAQGGGPDIISGKPLHAVYTQENLSTLKEGCKNLGRHIENARKFGLRVIVAVNRFATDTDAELGFVRDYALSAGVDAAVISNHWAEGGAGARELAEAVVAVCEGPSNFKFLYDLDTTAEAKILSVSTSIYGADRIHLSELAREQIDVYTKQGYGNLPVCIAKTPYSFSHDPNLKGAPTGFTIPVREIRLSAGAGFLYPILGDMQTMSGLVTRPGFWEVDLDNEGKVVGLF
ncbi:hypothetical protein BOTBODRAFT_110444 [Botryobasidium botryosum FD-172 SS1]|uniref:Methenyltetrahydrofolate cyclohydrolase n=1 Tax=Botryobasidium botryosum (strain FD-172 SS1) TaxID=930990 RepID=A0A067MRA7_BOTB1|nr:hypothetical protein BOTBODRAFT_110444 [Botryobasidium botryosum FD-172 SS1]